MRYASCIMIQPLSPSTPPVPSSLSPTVIAVEPEVEATLPFLFSAHYWVLKYFDKPSPSNCTWKPQVYQSQFTGKVILM